MREDDNAPVARIRAYASHEWDCSDTRLEALEANATTLPDADSARYRKESPSGSDPSEPSIRLIRAYALTRPDRDRGLSPLFLSFDFTPDETRKVTSAWLKVVRSRSTCMPSGPWPHE